MSAPVEVKKSKERIFREEELTTWETAVTFGSLLWTNFATTVDFGAVTGFADTANFVTLSQCA